MIFSGIWAKIVAGLSVLLGIFFLIIRYQSGKIEDLEHENKIHEVKDEIQDKDAEFKAKIIADEQDEVLSIAKMVNDDDKEITTDDLNSL